MNTLKQKLRDNDIDPYDPILKNWEDIYASITIDIPNLNINLIKVKSNVLNYYQLLEIISELQRDISKKKQNLDENTPSVKKSFKKFFDWVKNVIPDALTIAANATKLAIGWRG